MILLVFSLVTNFVALLIVRRFEIERRNLMEAAGTPMSLKARGRSSRRLRTNRLAELIATAAAVAAIAVLAIVIGSVLIRGLGALNLDLVTKNQVTFGETGGGIANALVGTAIMVGIATAIALPFGILVALYVAEFAPTQIGRAIRLGLDVLNGVPSIVIGIFAYALLVVGSGYAAWKGSVALAIIMLPLIARSTMEVLDLVPNSLREASFALGVSRWRTVLFVIVPTVFWRRADGKHARHRPRGRRDRAAPVHDVDLPPEPDRHGSEKGHGVDPAA